jgi:4'-phosphopantetheinyl transferase
MPYESLIDSLKNMKIHDDPSLDLNDMFQMFRLGVPPEPNSLEGDEVHIFYADVDSLLCCAGSLENTLSDEEKYRKDRFLLLEDKVRYIISRGLLRIILGAYLGNEPKYIVIKNGPHGKPMLDGGSDPDAIRFSVSHSNRRALYAINRGREIGVDVEKMRPEFPVEEISDHYFSAREAAFLRTLPAPEREDVFFTYWTLKEAFMKGTGEGFSLPMNRFEITHDPPKVSSLQGNSDAAARWSLRRLHLEPGYAAALAVAGADVPVRCWKLQLR